MPHLQLMVTSTTLWMPLAGLGLGLRFNSGRNSPAAGASEPIPPVRRDGPALRWRTDADGALVMEWSAL
jgi:hypothetical protein